MNSQVLLSSEWFVPDLKALKMSRVTKNGQDKIFDSHSQEKHSSYTPNFDVCDKSLIKSFAKDIS